MSKKPFSLIILAITAQLKNWKLNNKNNTLVEAEQTNLSSRDPRPHIM